MLENAGERRWRSHIPWAGPSTDNQCATRKRWRRKLVAAAWVFFRLPACAYKPGLQAACELAGAAQPRPKTHPIRSKILFVASWESDVAENPAKRQLLFTDMH
jgi:hypothetical protein